MGVLDGMGGRASKEADKFAAKQKAKATAKKNGEG